MEKFVKVKNNSSIPFVDGYAGDTYVIEPGEEERVPVGAAKLWFGDPKEDPMEEKKRVQRRRGELWQQLEQMEIKSSDDRAAKRRLKEAVAKVGPKQGEGSAEAIWADFDGDDDVDFLQD